MDIKRKINNTVISQKSSFTKPSKKRKFFGFLKGSKSPLGLLEPKKLFKTKKRKLIFSLALVLLIIAPLSFYLWNKQAGASWWNSDWNYRRSITINSAQIPGDLNNFPMLVSFTDSNLINKTQSNGNDIIFIEENGTRLNHEIEKFDNTTGELVAWVKIPELDGDNDSIIYMYYGNQTVDNQQRPEDVWDDGFKTVQHLKEDPSGTAPQSKDSTRNSKDGTSYGTMSASSLVATKIGKGVDFDGVDDAINHGDLEIGNSYTAEAWVRADTLVGTGDHSLYGYTIFASSATGSLAYPLWLTIIGTEARLWSYTDDNFGHTETTGANLTTGNWFHLVVVATKGGISKLYINGIEKLSFTNGGSADWTSVFTLGDLRPNRLITFDGQMDEVRISNSARSANWITTEYNNQNSPSTFISLGQEERGSAPALYLPFDEGFGTTAHDETSNRNDGTIVGATWKDESMCKSGKCLEFDGTGDYVEIADNPSLDLSEEVTLEAWVKPTSTTPQNQTILSKVETPNDPTKIYRSVGPSATTAIAVGTTNAMNITGDRATFATALPDNVGVGDVIQYDDDDDGTVDALAFITGRISNTQYTISNASGGAPNPVNSDNNWSLFRAYTSLANAESGIENTGIDSDLRNFDDWTAGGDATTDDVGKDLVAANQQWNIACYANGTTGDTTAVTIGGWTTGVNSFVKIYTPVSNNEVGVSQRHSGKWDDTKWHMEVSNVANGAALLNMIHDIYIDGLQISFDVAQGTSYAYGIRGEGEGFYSVSNCVVKREGSNTGGYIGGIHTKISNYAYIYNNIVFNISGGNTKSMGIVLEGGTGYLYSNTVYNCTGVGGVGIYRLSGTCSVKNNIAQNCTSGFLNIQSFSNSFSYNITNSIPNSDFAGGYDYYTNGITNGTVSNKLIASDTFITKGIKVGSVIRNVTDSTFTYVTAIDSETQLSIANDIFVSGEEYTIYTNKYGNVSFVSTTAGSEDFHLSPTDTVAKNSGADLSGDSVFPFNTDIDGQSRLNLKSPQGSTLNTDDTKFDIGADEAQATQIYRSVAPGKTDALETGDGNAMTINGSIATFQRALADNVGVGDVIQYDDDNDGDIDTSDSLAFITGRISNFKFQISNSAGGVPTAVAGDNDWSLFRAYASLANAESGTENTGINSNLRNFDTWSGGKDLVTSKEQWNIACYANGTTADTTAVTVDGWTTGVQNFVKIYTPVSESEVGVSQRHSGKWDTSKYYFLVNAGYIITINDNYTQFDGFQVEGLSDSYGGYYVYVDDASNISIKSNIIRVTKAYRSHAGIGTTNSTQDTKLINNVIYGFANGGITSSAGYQKTNYIYNNTIVNSGAFGIAASNNYIIAKNNLVNNCTTAYYLGSGVFIAGSDYNASDDGTSTGGANNKINQTFNFVNEAGGDYHLSPNDTVARNAGVNLSNDPYLPFETDIDGDKRLDLQGGGTTSWDIGADEAVATKIYRSVGPGNTSALATDEEHKNSAVVSSGVVNFSSSLPDRVGVGDAVLIDTNNDNAITSADTLLFISGRNSSTSYNLQTHTGAVPTNITSNDTYQIFRAYTSLANAESGTKNTSIPITFNGGNRDLVTNNEEWNIACYGDGIDTGWASVSDWTTGQENFVRIYTPVAVNEVGISQRHDGKWGSGYMRTNILQIQDTYVRVDGISLNTTSSRGFFLYQIGGDFGEIHISNCFGRENNISFEPVIYITSNSADITYKFYNNILVNEGTNTYHSGILVGDGQVYAYNNTIITNGGRGIDVGGSADAYLYNNIIKTTSGIGIKKDTTSSIFFVYNNTSSEGTVDDFGGLNNKVNQTFQFRDEANDDFRLAMTDTAAKGAGINLSNDINLPITNDIEGELRPSLVNSHQSSLNTKYQIQNTNFDIGADQISNTIHNNYSLNLKTNYPQTNFSTANNDKENFSSGDINLAPNQWSHLVYKRSNDTEEMYINGSKKDSGTISNFLKTNNGKLYLGSENPNSKNSFKGLLDEVRIYPYARTEAEVKKDTTQGSSGRAASRALEGVSTSIGDTASTLSDGLVGYWKMDETSWNGTVNEVKDASGNNNHGAAVGGATTAGGKFGSGGDFDGTDDWVTVPDSEPISITNAYTYSAWVRFDDVLTGLDTVISKQNPSSYDNGGMEWSIGRSSAGGSLVDGKVQMNITHNQTNYSTGWDYPYQQWFYLSVSWDGSMAKIYSNGELINTLNILGDLDTGNFPLLLGNGANAFDWDGEFSGAQDDIRLYNRALSEDEIKQLYNYAPGPVLHLKMDEKSGTTAFDSSGNDNHGTLVNGPIWENGKINGGLRFDGANDYVDVSQNIGLQAYRFNSAYSISMWVKGVGEGQADRRIFTEGNSIDYDSMFSLGVQTGTGKKLEVFLRNENADIIIPHTRSVADVFDNEWHHVSWVDESGNAKLYIDGKLDANNFSYSPQPISLDKTCVGAVLRNMPEYYFDGQIDDVRIYNYARTQEQILEDMGASAGASTSRGTALKSPVLDLSFDEGQGLTAFDGSGNGNNGTLNAGGSGTNATTTAMWDKGGKKNGAMEFDNLNDYINVGSNINIANKSFTISSWAKRNSNVDADYIAGQGVAGGSVGLHYGFRAGNTFTCAFGGNDLDAAISNDTNWHNWICSYDADTNLRIIYRDGKEIARGTATVDYQGSGVFNVGARYSVAESFFGGLVDDFKLYNYALSEDEIKTLYNDSSAMVMGNDESRDNNGTEVTGANKDYCIPGDTAKCDKPVLELKMDEMTGTTAYDSSGNGRNGTLRNGPVWDTGKIGSALNFDGIDDDIYNIPNVNIQGNFTISAWIKPETLSGERTIFYATSDFFVDLQNSVLTWRRVGANCLLNGSGVQTDVVANYGDVVAKDEWQYVAFVSDAANNKIYIYRNGKAVLDQAGKSDCVPTNNTENIGSTNSRRFDGNIDDFKIYDYARTPAQIAWDYNQGKPINHWTFDEGTGTTVHDEGPNLNNGTITGATWKNESECKTGKCLSFDGNNNIVSTNGNVDLSGTDNISVAFWFKYNSTANAQIILEHSANFNNNNGFLVDHSELGPNGALVLSDHNISSYNIINTNNSYGDNQWHHFVGTIDRRLGIDQNKIYVDGMPVETTLNASENLRKDLNGNFSSFPFYFGIRSDFKYDYTGQLDDIKIFNYALTPLQVQLEYNNSSAVNFR